MKGSSLASGPLSLGFRIIPPTASRAPELRVGCHKYFQYDPFDPGALWIDRVPGGSGHRR